MTTGTQSAPAALPQRKSSGLVRVARPFDALVYGIFFGSPGLGILLMLLYIPAFYPGANMYASLALGVGLGLFLNFSYAFLAAAMPRSGADYVWNSRILHPAIGVMTSVGFTCVFLIFAGFQAGPLTATLGIGPFFRQLGIATESDTMLRAANWFGTDVGGFVAGAVLLIGITLFFAFLGLKRWFYVQNAMFFIGTLGLIVVAIVAATTSSTELRADFNSTVAWQTGSQDTFGTVLQEGADAGFVVGPFDLRITLLAMSWVYASFIWGVSQTWIGGEIQRAGRTLLWTVPAATLIISGWAFLLIWLFDRMGALDFLGAAGFTGGGTLGFTPTFAELASYTVPVAVSAVIGVAFVIWPFVVTPGLMLMASRNLLAYSLDGIVPRKLSEIDRKRQTPLINLVVVLVGCLITLSLYQFTTVLVTLSTFLVFVSGFLITSIAAAVFPYARRDLFDVSPVRWRVAGIPVLTLVGIGSIAYNGLMLWVYLEDPTSGIAGNTRMILTNLGLIFAGVVVYLIAKLYWRGRGYDVDANYRELPVE
jgi:amino acid transporter